MTVKPHRSVVGLVSLIIGIAVYYFLAILSIYQYPGGFDIFNDLWTHLRWFDYNVDGALFFRVGNLIYGFTLVVFFLSFEGQSTVETELGYRKYLIQIIGMSIAASILIGEILVDQPIAFIITSGVNLLLTIVLLIAIVISMFNQPEFWRVSILLFTVAIVLSSYLLYMGAIDVPIREFRIIDLLVTALNQAAIFTIASNLTRIRTQ